MAATSERPIASSRGKCSEHGLALGPDGRCVLCRRDSVAPGDASRDPRSHRFPSQGGPSGSGFPIFGVLSVVVLLAGGYYGYLQMQAGSEVANEPPDALGFQPTFDTSQTEPRDGGHADRSAPLRRDEGSTPPQVEPRAQVEILEVVTASERSLEPDPAAGKQPTDAEIARYVGGLEVNLYTTSWCGYCEKARAFFSHNGIRYREHDVERDPSAKTRRDELGPGRGVPVVEIEGQVIAGFNPRAYAAAIERGVEKASGVPVQIALEIGE